MAQKKLRATRNLDFPFYFGGMTFPYYGFFAGGAMAAVIAFGSSGEAVRLRRLPWGWIAAAGLAGSFAALCVWPKSTYTGSSELFACPFALAISSLLIVLASAAASPSPIASAVKRFLSASLLASLGGFSYSLYLIHYPLCLLLGRALGRCHLLGTAAGFWIVLLAFWPTVILAAYMFSRAFERRFQFSRV